MSINLAALGFGLAILSSALHAVTWLSRRYWRNAYLDLGERHARTLDELQNLRACFNDDATGYRAHTEVQPMQAIPAAGLVPPRREGATGQPLPGVPPGDRQRPPGAAPGSGSGEGRGGYARTTIDASGRVVSSVRPPADDDLAL